MWALIIVCIFMTVLAFIGVPAVVTGTTASDNIVKAVIPYSIGALTVVLAFIGIFGSRH